MPSDQNKAKELARLLEAIRAERNSSAFQLLVKLLQTQIEINMEAMIWIQTGDPLTLAQGRTQGVQALLEAITKMPLQERLAADETRRKLEGISS
jgi:hypothetical protein